MRRRPFLAVLFNLEPGETRIVLAMMLFSAAAGLAMNYTFTASSALFLAQFNADQLPFTILASSFALVATRFAYQQAERRQTPTRILIGSLVFLAVMILAIRVGLAVSHAAWLIFAVTVFARIVTSILVVGFWGLANRLFTITQSKRLFSVISAGPIIPTMIGSFLLPVITPIVGTENLFFFILAAVLVALWAVLYIQRHFTDVLAPSETVAAPKTDSVPLKRANLLSSPYILLIAGLYMLYWLIYAALDYTYLGQLQIQFASSPEQIASFIGAMFGLIQLVNFVLKFFFAGRLISRFGLRLGLFITPVFLIVGFALSLLVGSVMGTVALFFWLIISTKFNEEVLRDSFHETSVRILYQPMPIEQRAAAVALVEGYGASIAAFVTGLLLSFLTLTGTATPLSITGLLLVLSIGLAVLVLRTYREYTGVVRSALERRILNHTQSLPTEAFAQSVLIKKLDSRYPDEVIYALGLLESIEPEVAYAQMPALLQSPLPDVRLHVLEKVTAADESGIYNLVDSEKVWSVVENDPVPEVRAAALKAFAALFDFDAVTRVQPYLTCENLVMRRGAMVGLLRNGGLGGTLIAGQALYALLQSPQVAHRKLAAQVLNDIAVYTFYEPALQLLSDTDQEVRQAALIAAGSIKHPKLVPAMIAALNERSLRPFARQALANSGDAFLAEVGTRLQNGDDSDVLRQLLIVCARMRSPAVIDMLSPYLDWAQVETRTHILRALAQNGYHIEPDAHETYNRIEQRILTECAYTHDQQGLLAALESANVSKLLRTSLGNAIKDGQERVILLLSFLFDRQAVLNSHAAFRSGTAQQRAFASEMLDISLVNGMKSPVMRLLKGGVPATEFTHDSLTTRLNTLAHDPRESCWLRAVAAYAVRQRSSTPVVIPQELTAMLSTIERVLILKTVPIFDGIPDSVLAELAALVTEAEYPAGTTIFSKGDEGKSMYVIVSGKVRVHDGAVTFGMLGDRDVFGEMAVLATEPRTATVTALEDTTVFSLDQAPFYEAMADYPEISREIIRVLIGFLRTRMQDVTELSSRVKQLEGSNSIES